MISLLITLFISLFTYCPTVYQVEHKVNNEVVKVSQPIKKEADLDGYVQYFGIGYFYGEHYLNQFVSYLHDNQHATTGDYNNWSLYSGGSVEWVWNMSTGGELGIFNIADDGTVSSYGYVPIDGYTWRKTNINTQRNDFFFELNYNGNWVIRYAYRVFFNLSAHDISANNPYDGLSGTIVVDTSLSVNTGYSNSFKYFGMYTINYYNDSYLYSMVSQDNVYEQGYDTGYWTGYRTGKQEGYQEGLDVSGSYDPVANSILTGIFDIGLLPVNVFLTIFNFEVFGVNIAGILSGLLTLSISVIVLRFLFGGKDYD